MFGFQLFKRRSHIIALIMLIFVMASMLFFSNTMAKHLANEEKAKMQIWAEAYRVIGSETSSERASKLATDVITSNETIPLLILDQDGNIASRNIRLPKKGKEVFLQEKLEAFSQDSDYPPIEVSLSVGDEVFTVYIYYGPSNLLRLLALFPFVQISIILVFAFAIYMIFSASKRAEENRVWVGLSKETAHQLGTPISSLNAWIELIKHDSTTPSMVEEMQKDIDRLQVVASRFSKIGSKVALELSNLSEVLDQYLVYMSKRISKKVTIHKKYDPNHFVPVLMNEQLFAWVVENLIKNAVDAMRGGGNIIVTLEEDEHQVFIDVKDEGKGLAKNQYKEVFTPGFSTKKRGWGLGLSFAKRIIKDYHNGKIFVKKSEIDKGTTFRVVLPKANQEK